MARGFSYFIAFVTREEYPKPNAHLLPPTSSLLSSLQQQATMQEKPLKDFYLASVHGTFFTGYPGLQTSPNAALTRVAITLQPQSSTKKKRLPYTVEIIAVLLTHLDPDIPLDAAVGSCLTTGYYSCARLGELTVKTLMSFDLSIHVKPSNIRKETDPNGLAMTVLGIPVTKSKQSSENIFYTAQNNSTYPRRAFENHLHVNTLPPNSHLFSYKHKQFHRPLTKTASITHFPPPLARRTISTNEQRF
ncbi:hypothetical protein B0H10DRAFT_2224160 [Mycena sp. CBHHK59/15]|nr:hypothetical protein B0H10DRAFT_2224160 [Mycena sp. CBHHK59/15]